MRDPKKNPFIPTNVVFWLRTNRYTHGEYEYSTKPGEWGYCQLVKTPISFHAPMLAQLAKDWSDRTYSEEFDPPASEEIAINAALVIQRLLKEEPELIDLIDDNGIAQMGELLSSIEITKDTKIH